MKDNFGWLIEDTLDITSPTISWIKEIRPTEFNSYKINPGPKTITVTSDGWIDSKKKLSMRYARFQSEIMDIATIMIYPIGSPNLFPVFAVEWVAIMNNIHVIVLDVTNLVDNSSIESLAILKDKWLVTFPENKDKPNWFKEIAAPQHIFSKSTIDYNDKLRLMFKEFLSTTVNQVYLKNKPSVVKVKDHELVRKYKQHHSINSPARTIVKKENEDWLETFLEKYHFGII